MGLYRLQVSQHQLQKDVTHRQLHPITSGRFPHYNIPRGLLRDFVNSADLTRNSNRAFFMPAGGEKMAQEALITDYFYGDESEQFSYFRIPRLLITSPRFKGLSTDAKLLYGIKKHQKRDFLVP